jgi:ArsR family transcriptional regulator
MKPLRQIPDTECARRLRVLADPTRLSILEILMAGPKCVGEINEPLGVEPTLLSHHLRTLREAGLVLAERDGKNLVYRLAPGVSVPRSGAADTGKGIDLGCCKLSFE